MFHADSTMFIIIVVAEYGGRKKEQKTIIIKHMDNNCSRSVNEGHARFGHDTISFLESNYLRSFWTGKANFTESIHYGVRQESMYYRDCYADGIKSVQ